jgi:hypothetical protein
MTCTTRLDRLARRLDPAPDVAPYHVSAVKPGHPSPGWYWRPHGHQHNAYLGFNHVQAELALLTLQERQEATT